MTQTDKIKVLQARGVCWVTDGGNRDRWRVTLSDGRGVEIRKFIGGWVTYPGQAKTADKRIDLIWKLEFGGAA